MVNTGNSARGPRHHSTAPGGNNQNKEIWNYIIAVLIVFIVFGTLISVFNRKGPVDKSYDTAVSEKEIINIEKEKFIVPEKKPEGKIVSPASQYEVGQLRQSLDLPEEEEKDSRRSHEEVLKKDPQAKFVF